MATSQARPGPMKLNPLESAMKPVLRETNCMMIEAVRWVVQCNACSGAADNSTASMSLLFIGVTICWV